MPSAKRVLGRGLADLIPVGGAGVGAPPDEPGHDVPIASLHPNPRQPRIHFDEASLSELAESIRANGILQPLLVRPRASGGYEIVAGERRYRGALKAGLTRVPVVVRSLSDEETLALALVENLIREDIGPLETARAFQRLMDDFNWTHEEMAQRVGKSRSAVTNALRLLDLPEFIQMSLDKGELSEGHARPLLKKELPRPQQRRIWQRTVREGLSVRAVERLVNEAAAPTPAASLRTPRISVELEAVADRLRAAIGLKVRVIGGEERGRVEVDYFTPEDLDGLLSLVEGHRAEEATAPPAGKRRPTPGNGPIQGLLTSRPRTG